MKVFIAGLATETNAFSPIPTGRLNFEETYLHFGDATAHSLNMFTAPMSVWRKRAEERGWKVVESLAAFAQPAGFTVKAVYEEFRDRILSDLKNALPVDIVLLTMHGAMAAQGYEDCEADLLCRVRAIVGEDAVVGAEFDPHAHLSEGMMSAADLLIFYKEYPHIDSEERAEELFALAVDTAAGVIKPVMADVDCRMLGIFQTPVEPMKSYVRKMQEAEKRDGVLSLSLVHGFPWGEHPRLGARMLAITDGDRELAAVTADEFAKKLWSIREGLRPSYPGIEAALDQAQRIFSCNPGRPVILADLADNAGGGAPADSTFFLEALIKRGLKGVASGIYYDPGVVRICLEAGVGASLPLRIGGKTGETSGDPVDLVATVRAIRRDVKQKFGGTEMPMGVSVWLESNGVHLIVNDLRTQVLSPEAFIGHGLEIRDLKIVVVKSTQHFFDKFEPLAEKIIHTAGPGALTFDYENIPYRISPKRFWPLVDNPFKASGAALTAAE